MFRLSDWGCCSFRSPGSLQLSQLGLGQSVVRLTLATLQDMPITHMAQTLEMAFEASVPFVEFLEMISDVDAGMFWVPCESSDAEDR